MIVVRAPLRISFAGGGSDLVSWLSSGESGAVVSSAINKYIYVVLMDHFSKKRVRVSYSITESVSSADQLNHELVREALLECNLQNGVEIATLADVPGKGTGLGSSSSLTVALLHAIAHYQGKNPSRRWLAETACLIEIVKAKKRIGKQDQYASAYGGVNFMRFEPNGMVFVEALKLEDAIIQRMNEVFSLFYLGKHRRADNILKVQNTQLKESEEARTHTRALRALAFQAKDAFERGDFVSLGYILNENWERKREINPSSTDNEIDTLYQKALSLGALGGKVCGAGGGGFLLLQMPDPDMGKKIEKALKLKRYPVQFGVTGSEVVLNI